MAFAAFFCCPGCTAASAKALRDMVLAAFCCCPRCTAALAAALSERSFVPSYTLWTSEQATKPVLRLECGVRGRLRRLPSAKITFQGCLCFCELPADCTRSRLLLPQCWGYVCSFLLLFFFSFLALAYGNILLTFYVRGFPTLSLICCFFLLLGGSLQVHMLRNFGVVVSLFRSKELC